MKKIVSVLAMVLAVSCVFAGCGKGGSSKNGADVVKGEGVMTYAEYVAADVDSQVVVETYIQDRQGWWDNNGVGVASFYTQDAEGAYFLYNLPCSQEDYNSKLVPGAKIKVTGYKTVWSGEVEIIDASWELLNGSYLAEPVDLTAIIDKDEVETKMNMYAVINDLEVVAQDNGAAFLYGWDGSGTNGDDLYFKVKTANGTEMTFTVESYLRNQDSEVYGTVLKLQPGDKISAKCFVYFYEGAQPHVVEVIKK